MSRDYLLGFKINGIILIYKETRRAVGLTFIRLIKVARINLIIVLLRVLGTLSG